MSCCCPRRARRSTGTRATPPAATTSLMRWHASASGVWHDLDSGCSGNAAEALGRGGSDPTRELRAPRGNSRGAERRGRGDGVVGVVGRVSHRLRLGLVLLRATGRLDGGGRGGVHDHGADRLSLVAVLIPGIGVEVAGSRRWLGTGILRFQPTEVAKLALLVFAADVVSRRAKELHDWRRVLRPVLIVLAIFGALVLREPDLDSTVVLTLIAFTVLIVGGVRPRHLAVVGSVAAVAGTILALSEPYRRARMFAFLHPSADAASGGYQISQSLIAIGSGGWTGVGLGAGRAKWLFLPNAHT